MKSKENFQKKLKLLRESLKMNQKEFAESIEVTQATLSAYELGKQVPASPVLLLISEKYNVSIDWLFDSIESQQDIKITTYSDLFNALFNLSDFFDIEKHYDLLNNPEIAQAYADQNLLLVEELENSIKPYFSLISKNSIVSEFLHSLDDMNKLLKNGTISEFVYEAWKSETLKKYENELINKKSS